MSAQLMSNPEYEDVKNKLVELDTSQIIDYHRGDMNEKLEVRQYIQLAQNAQAFGLDGVVIGAPSDKNHISDEEIARVRDYLDNERLILLPGVGAQGGEAGKIWGYFGPNNVIVNVGRSAMLPNGSNSTPQEQREAAKHYQGMLNKLRVA